LAFRRPVSFPVRFALHKAGMGPEDLSSRLYTTILAGGVKKIVANSFFVLTDLSDFRVQVGNYDLLRIGDCLNLRFRLERMHNGRREMADVDGEFRVTSVRIDHGPTGQRQIAQIAATRKAPVWRSVKLLPPRVLGPARFPPTEVK